jgi:hypothetical protein
MKKVDEELKAKVSELDKKMSESLKKVKTEMQIEF